jgi:hypothetical protein
MKFVMALLTFATMAFILGWGIFAAVQPDGKPWLLIAGALRRGTLTLFSQTDFEAPPCAGLF